MPVLREQREQMLIPWSSLTIPISARSGTGGTGGNARNGRGDDRLWHRLTVIEEAYARSGRDVIVKLARSGRVEP
jgi:hypothetical protein